MRKTYRDVQGKTVYTYVKSIFDYSSCKKFLSK